MKINIKSIFVVTIQVIIVVLCIATINYRSTFSEAVQLLLKYSSYLVCIAGAFFAIRFNRSRVFFIVIILAISQFVMVDCKMFIKTDRNLGDTLYPILCILTPLNIFLFSLIKERGLMSMWGKLRIGSIIIQILMVLQIVVFNKGMLESMVKVSFVEIEFIDLQISQIAVCIYIFAIVTLVIRTYYGKGSGEISIIVTLVLTFLAYNSVYYQETMSIYFTGAGVILIIGLIEESYKMAYLDELTGIPARRALREHLMKLDNKYVIAMVDIDFFKKFNDKYGHDIGDEVLKLVATNLQGVTGGGKAFRYGGEEFSIIFAKKTISEVVPHLEKLREEVAKATYTYKPKSTTNAKGSASTGRKLSVTISIGVADKNSKYRNQTEVMKGADKALYRAKKKGRNCVSK